MSSQVTTQRKEDPNKRKIDLRQGTPPLISVVLPTSNAAQYLPSTLESFKNQDSSLFEVIVIDNESVDESIHILANFVNESPDNRCLISEKDQGVADAFNKGITLARGRYLYFIGAGDQLRPGIFSQIANYMTDGTTDIIYGDIHVRACNRDVRYTNLTPLYLANRSVCHQSIFYRRTIFNRFGGYNPRYQSFSDSEFNLRCFFSPQVKSRHISVIIADYLGNGPSDFGDPVFELDRENLIAQHLGPNILNAYQDLNGRNLRALARLEKIAEQPKTKWVIFGAGALGRSTLLDCRIPKTALKQFAGFVDSDLQREGLLFQGYPIMAPTRETLTHDIDLVLIAIGSEAGRTEVQNTLITAEFPVSKIFEWH